MDDPQEIASDGPSLIVAAVDGTDTSMRAAAYATGLARRGGARLVFLFVRGLGGLSSATAMSASLVRAGEDETFRELTRIAAERVATLGVSVTVVDRAGDPYHVITQVVREQKADLIVVGASMGIGHKVAGALGSRLIKAKICPVLVVP